MSLSAKPVSKGIEDFEVTSTVSKNLRFSELALISLTFLFGLQMFKALLPGLTWILGDRFRLGPLQVVPIVLLLFSASFLAGRLLHFAGGRRSLILTAGGLGLARLLLQIRWDEPLINLILAMAGTVLFLLFLPIYLDKTRPLAGNPEIVLGLLLGFVLDTALHGAFSTYDLVWRPGWTPMLITLALVVIQWISLAATRSANEIDNSGSDSNSGAKRLGWLAIGPFFFLQIVVFQNVARVTVLTGWPLPWAFGWTLLAQVAALGSAVYVLNKKDRILWPLALSCGVVLIAVSALSPSQDSWLAALALLIGQICLSLLVVLILVGASDRIGRVGAPGVPIVFGLSMLLFLVLFLGYYTVYLVHLPYHNTVLEPIAASIIAFGALVSCTSRLRRVRTGHKAWIVPGATMILLVLPLAGILRWQEPSATAEPGFPGRVMTYNLHSGFNTDGTLDLEAIARVIEDNDPDIIALQEISRGWVISGRVDMLTWLSQRLNMSFVSGPTADPFWGSAIFSRYPIEQYENHELLPRDLPVRRGFISAEMDLGSGESLKVIATHFHHSWDPENPLDYDSNVRQLQSQSILDFWNGADRTVLLGDFNATPSATEMATLTRTGFLDLGAQIEPPPDHTWPADDPIVRIDYVWISPDLRSRGLHVPVSTASDHFPVVAIIDKGE
jgi:endonuclease/exonuclease/phosphatase family metal-dependent hydrolase